MKKRIFSAFVLLVLLCVHLLPLQAFAMEQVDTSRDCSLELEYSHTGTAFPGLEIRIYRFAEIHPDGNYNLIAPYSSLPVKIHGIRSQKEWRDAASTLVSYISANESITPTAIQSTDENGIVTFSGLDTGIYLVKGITAKTDSHIYNFEDFCVFLPTPHSNGTQDYDVSAKPKCSVSPNEEVPVTYQVVKLWKDLGYSHVRPKKVTIDILKNGTVQETVELNAANNWTYSWTAPAGTDVWTVVEKDVPSTYTVVITHAGNVFTITNTRPTQGQDPPKTGDTFALGPWLTAMSVSGILLLACGILMQRKRK